MNTTLNDEKRCNICGCKVLRCFICGEYTDKNTDIECSDDKKYCIASKHICKKCSKKEQK